MCSLLKTGYTRVGLWHVSADCNWVPQFSSGVSSPILHIKSPCVDTGSAQPVCPCVVKGVEQTLVSLLRGLMQCNLMLFLRAQPFPKILPPSLLMTDEPPHKNHLHPDDKAQRILYSSHRICRASPPNRCILAHIKLRKACSSSSPSNHNPTCLPNQICCFTISGENGRTHRGHERRNDII